MRFSKLSSPVLCKPDNASCKRLARPTTNFEPGALVGVKIVQQSTIVGGLTAHRPSYAISRSLHPLSTLPRTSKALKDSTSKNCLYGAWISYATL
ncbi:hypothetical protein NXS19_001858 [Fusarium pseudograminearum]|nr:hypothetical protein NXS19_001858 [Fusarium pseudograminearum]